MPLSSTAFLATVLCRPWWFKEIIDDRYRDKTPPSSESDDPPASS